MQRAAFAAFIVIVLGLGLFLGGGSIGVYGQVPQNEVELELQQSTWDHSTLNVLIVTEEDESWWKEVYANSTLRAVSMWNNALRAFASNYSEFGYLSRLRMTPTVSTTLTSGFDVYILWTTEPLKGGDENVGLAVTYSTDGIVLNCTITLDVYNQLGTALSEVDMQNVAAHEVGHALGLSHCNYSGDVMYPLSLLASPARAISTLDTYGVALVFGWMANSNQPNPGENWPKTTSAMLPAEIEYQHFEIMEKNIPPYSNLEPIIGPLRVILEIILMFIPLELLITIVAVMIILVVALLLYQRRK
jgi:predicted Zn-dependent protease